MRQTLDYIIKGKEYQLEEIGSKKEMNSNQYIFYFEYKSMETIVDNTVYTDIETVLKKAIQIGRAFDPNGKTILPME